MSESSDNQNTLEQLQRAGNALARGLGAEARALLMGLRANFDDVASLDETLRRLLDPDDADLQAAIYFVDHAVDRYEARLSSGFGQREGSQFKLPRPLTLSQASPLPNVQRGAGREQNDNEQDEKETRQHPALASKGSASRPLSLTERLQKAIKKPVDEPTQLLKQPPVEKVEEPEDDFFADFDLGLSAPVVEQAPADPALWGPGDETVVPFASTSPNDSVPPALTDASPRRAPGRLRQETPMVSVMQAEALATDTARAPSESDVSGHSPQPAELASGLDDPSAPSLTGVMSAEALASRLHFRDPVDEDEFFALAESLASEASDPMYPGGLNDSRSGYRGEPVVREQRPDPTPPPSSMLTRGHTESTNPFAHEAPTGVRNQPLPAYTPPPPREPDVSKITSERDRPVRGSLLEQARILYEQGDFQSALDVIQALLTHVQDSEATALQGLIEGELERQQHERLGSLGQVPVLAIDLAQLSRLSLDHRAGFLISQIDGMLCYEDIIDMSTMSRLETMTLLAELCDKGIIVVD